MYRLKIDVDDVKFFFLVIRFFFVENTFLTCSPCDMRDFYRKSLSNGPGASLLHAIFKLLYSSY